MNKLLSMMALLAFFTACSSTNVAKKTEGKQESEPKSEAAMALPTKEKAFVNAINKFDKKAIIAQLGEPAKADDVRLKGSDKIVASIWHYHYVNTDQNGQYYQTTELDFIEDKVVQVVFINNDGLETNGLESNGSETNDSENNSPEAEKADRQHYDIPKPAPNQ